MPDRINTPELKPVDHIGFVKPRIFDIAKRTRLFFMADVADETSRVDLYFDAGSIRGNVGIASLVNGLLLSGTKTKTSVEIHGELDALGAFHESNVGHETAVFSIYALRENMIPILKILRDSIDNLSFPEHEVEELVSDRKQKFRVNMEKVSFLAQRSFQQKMFDGTQYARIIEESDYDNFSLAEMKQFHRDCYLSGLLKVVVVGAFSQDDVDAIIDITGGWSNERQPEYEQDIQNAGGTFHTAKKDALQTAIRVGRTLFNKRHEDYIAFQVLNTILGDYFGSRLMSNIREDKGYTYGIGSMVAELHESGYFLIATEVKKEVKEDTLTEIRYEMERLRNELVDKDELELVKNYLLGQLLKSADGPYSMTDLYMGLEPYGMDMEFYNDSIRVIREITPEKVQYLAVKYLNWDEMTVVTAG